MNQNELDEDQLGIILKYCDRLERSQERFGRNFQAFSEDIQYQDSCSLCLIQIGEAVNRLSDGFKDKHETVSWRKIYGMRCHLVHGYESFDLEIAWDVMERYIPPLQELCRCLNGEIQVQETVWPFIPNH